MADNTSIEWADATWQATFGNAGAWRPAAAQFGAAAPVVRERPDDEDDPEEDGESPP